MANSQIAALARRGMARCKANQFDAAIADFTTVIGASPGIAAVWYNRGYAWYRKGDTARAVADWEQAAALAPDNALYRDALKKARAAAESAKRAITPDTRPGYAPARPNPVNGMNTPKSSFDGSMLQWLGWFLLGLLITVITLGICFPWAFCMMYRWEVNHTVINGKRLQFTGTGGSLFGHWIIWFLLSVITFGIFGLWVPVKIAKWKAERTSFKGSAD